MTKFYIYQMFPLVVTSHITCLIILGLLYKELNLGAFLSPKVKLQSHDAVYQLRFYSNSLIHILSLSNSHNNVASLEKNRGDNSHHVIVALQTHI